MEAFEWIPVSELGNATDNVDVFARDGAIVDPKENSDPIVVHNSCLKRGNMLLVFSILRYIKLGTDAC